MRDTERDPAESVLLVGLSITHISHSQALCGDGMVAQQARNKIHQPAFTLFAELELHSTSVPLLLPPICWNLKNKHPVCDGGRFPQHKLIQQTDGKLKRSSAQPPARSPCTTDASTIGWPRQLHHIEVGQHRVQQQHGSVCVQALHVQTRGPTRKAAQRQGVCGVLRLGMVLLSLRRLTVTKSAPQPSV